MHFSPPQLMSHASSISSQFDHANNIWEEWKLRNSDLWMYVIRLLMLLQKISKYYTDCCANITFWYELRNLLSICNVTVTDVNSTCGLVLGRRFSAVTCQMDVTRKCHVRAFYPGIRRVVVWSRPVGDIQHRQAALLRPVKRRGNWCLKFTTKWCSTHLPSLTAWTQ